MVGRGGAWDSMRIVLIVVVALVVLVGGVVFFFPMSIAADVAAKAEPDFRFADATGSVWNGTLKGVTLGRQDIGDVKVSAKPGELLKGRVGGKVALVRPDATAEGDLSVGFDGRNPSWRNLKLSGKASAIPGLPARLANTAGQFSLTVDQLDFKGDLCTAAKGEAWTNVLAVEAFENGWKGPELRGPLACENGTLFVAATGVSPNGEDVTARVDMARNASLALDARVNRVGPDGAKALAELGFRPDGADYVLSHRLGAM